MHTIEELMDSTPIRLRMDSSLADACRGMAQSDKDVLALCDPHGYFLGVVTHAALEHARGSMGALAYSLRAQHLMTTTAPTVTLDHSIDEALSLMAAHAIEFLPVVKDGMLRGMLTSGAIAAEEAPTTIAGLAETKTTPTSNLSVTLASS